MERSGRKKNPPTPQGVGGATDKKPSKFVFIQSSRTGSVKNARTQHAIKKHVMRDIGRGRRVYEVDNFEGDEDDDGDGGGGDDDDQKDQDSAFDRDKATDRDGKEGGDHRSLRAPKSTADASSALYIESPRLPSRAAKGDVTASASGCGAAAVDHTGTLLPGEPAGQGRFQTPVLPAGSGYGRAAATLAGRASSSAQGPLPIGTRPQPSSFLDVFRRDPFAPYPMELSPAMLDIVSQSMFRLLLSLG